MPPPKRTRDLIIQTTDGQIYAISGDTLSDPVYGDPVGMGKLKKTLALLRGRAVGLRTAVMGYPLPIPIGQNNFVSVLERNMARFAGTGKSPPAAATKKSARGTAAKKSAGARKTKS